MKFLSRIVFSFALVLASLAAIAGEMPFSQKIFDDLRANGKPVVVHVHASWCGVCKKQAEIMDTLAVDKQFKDLTVLRADFDTEKDLLKTLKVVHQSTFVAFKGGTEVARSAGETNKDSIAALLAKAQ